MKNTNRDSRRQCTVGSTLCECSSNHREEGACVDEAEGRELELDEKTGGQFFQERTRKPKTSSDHSNAP